MSSYLNSTVSVSATIIVIAIMDTEYTGFSREAFKKQLPTLSLQIPRRSREIY